MHAKLNWFYIKLIVVEDVICQSGKGEINTLTQNDFYLFYSL